MSREEFLRRLEALLSDLPKEEREEAIAWYRDYLDEVGSEREQEALRTFGSPERVAEEIRAGLQGDGQSGVFTENGYQEKSCAGERLSPDRYAGLSRSGSKGNAGERTYEERNTRRESTNDRWEGTEVQYEQESERRKKRNIRRLIFVAVCVCFGIPFLGAAFSAILALVCSVPGLIIGLAGGMLGLVAGTVALAVGLLTASVALFGAGIAGMAEPAIGTMLIALGFFSASGGILSALGARWLCATAIPVMVRTGCRWGKQAYSWCREKVQGIAAKRSV